MEFVVSNKIKVIDANVTIKQYCKKNLVLDNPDFYKKQKMGKWTGNTPRVMTLYEVDNAGTLILPFGCLSDIWDMYPVKQAFRNCISGFDKVSYCSNISLYPYQEKALKTALTKRNGVIVMPCGSGKTQTALELAHQIGGKTLWLTHTQDLLRQSMNRAKEVFELDADAFGKITEGKVAMGKVFTFATVQTMSKLDLTAYKDLFDIVIVDECHKAIGSPTKVMQFYKVLSNLSARYKYGITATPKRADGLERSMFALLGDIICEVSKKEVAHTTCPIKAYAKKTDFYPDMNVVLAGDGTLNYSSLVDNLIHDETRFNLIANYIDVFGHTERTLVLANRVEYLERLCKNFQNKGGKAVCLSGMGTSKKAKAKRKSALQQLNSGEIDCVFATYQLAKEGLDIPQLRYLIFATPEKDKTTITQAVGRVGRKAEGKKYGVVVDFVDGFGMYQGWWKKRKNVYKSIDCEVLE